MPLRIGAQQQFFAAKAHQVFSPDRLELHIDLPFGLTIIKIVQVHGFVYVPPETDKEEDETYQRARHCLVTLVGSQRVVVQPTEDRANLYRRAVITARVYLDRKIFGKPVGYTPKLSAVEGPVLEVGPYMGSLRQHDFPVSRVRRLIRSRPAVRT